MVDNPPPGQPQKLLAETLGTAMLVFVGVGSVPATTLLGGDAPFTMAQLGVIAFAFAMVVVAMVYAIGHISGCHINPAVTLVLAATRRTPWREVPGYLAAQAAGAILGALAIVAVLGRRAVGVGLGVASYTPVTGAGHAFAAEAIGTFILAFVVLGAIDRRAPAGFAGLAVGLAVFAVIIPIGPATGAAVNPARAFGPMAVAALFGGSVPWGQLPLYAGAEVAGALLAGLVHAAFATRRTPAARTADTAGRQAPATATATATEGALS
ncbi:putative MIP family channel protein [Actinacidiphila reveromycinica]|uniref:Putative MIP family channel protein n=1 Tax=Actinacidiphila reveromycinica TaxID=659352 RepID=A0A7U3UZ92_9ACTN|nr:MIP/aquaporin family protein [Streptomyces sp. SN-593]BBB01546.1 putative MIP family channel protein [Streptomyces sp. SN-593]